MSGAGARRIGSIVGAAAILIVAGGLAGCGVNDSGQPRRIDVGLGLGEPVTASTTSTTIAAGTSTTVELASQSTTTTAVEAPSTTIVATENVPLFFISGTQLTSISIPLTSPATLGQVMVALQSGPLVFGPPGTGLRSAIPLDLPPIVVTDDGDGTAAVELPPTFFDKILAFDQRLAIAQIVLSLTNQRGIGSVRFNRFGAPISVILGSGEQSDPGQPVTKADYRSLVIGSETTISPATSLTTNTGTTNTGTTNTGTTNTGTTTTRNAPTNAGPATTSTADDAANGPGAIHTP